MLSLNKRNTRTYLCGIFFTYVNTGGGGGLKSKMSVVD